MPRNTKQAIRMALLTLRLAQQATKDIHLN
jgi:hypothetical protein